MGKQKEAPQSFVLSVLDDDLEKEIVRLVTSDESMDRLIEQLLEMLHHD